MKPENITRTNRYPYERVCDECNESVMIRTQKDEDPEYYTEVYVKCSCGDYVLFMVPVN